MKKTIFSFIIITIFALNLSAQEEIKTNKDTKDLPEIYFKETTHDYGTIKYGSDGECEFVFENTGKEPLILNNVRSSCGCTTPVWPKSPVKKGKEGVIKVKYNTHIVGPFSKTIRVYSNAKTSLVTLKITGKVVRESDN